MKFRGREILKTQLDTVLDNLLYPSLLEGGLDSMISRDHCQPKCFCETGNASSGRN